MKLSKVLLIEDNEDISRLVFETLKKQCETKIASSAEDAICVLKDFTPEIILVDIMLPGMSGYEFAALMKNDERLKAIPLVALSAKSGVEAHKIAYDLGFINYLEKPFQTSELLSLTKSVISNFERKIEVPMEYHDLRLDPDQRCIICGENILGLTPKEYLIMYHLMKNAERIVTREYFISKLDFNEKDAIGRSLDNFISCLRKKISQSKIQIKTHYSMGYELGLKKVS